MSLIERAQHILLRPRDTWTAIEAEPASVGSLYRDYLMILAALPAVCGFIGMSVVGISPLGFGSALRVPFLAGFVNAAISYAVSLSGVFVLALVVDALAPLFGGMRNRTQALKVVVYSSTAAMLGGVFALVPALVVLGLLPALYSIYLLHTGLPVLMKSPTDHSVGYTASVLVAGLILSLALAAASSQVAPRLGPAGISAVTGHTTVAERQLDQLQPQLQVATQGDDGAAPAVAALHAALRGAAGGDGEAAHQGRVAMASLKAAVPATLAGLPRTSVAAQDGTALGLPTSQASAEYGNDARYIRLDIIDMGGLGALAQLTALAQGERETGEEVERNWLQDGRALQEDYAKDGSHAELQVLLKNGVAIRLAGEAFPISELRDLLADLDLDALERLPRKPL